MKPIVILTWLLRIVAALIMLQTLYFKFTGHEQSVKLFTELGMEPWGRIGTGVFELIASVLILFPRTTGFGAALGLGLMGGAIFFHLTKLGIVFDGDAVLFTYAVIVFVCCLILLIIYRQQVLRLITKRGKQAGFMTLTVLLAGSASAQHTTSSINQFVDLSGTAGSSQGSVAAAYVHNWKLWKKQKFEIGVGARFTTYFGTKKEFLTSGPAKYTRTFTAPFLIFFAGQNEENFDTLTVQRPLTNSLNITANLGYNISPRWYAGFNIDVIGFTFGRKGSGIFQSNGSSQTEPNAKPAAFNILLTGDHDRGTLNSEFFLKYKVGNRWHLKGIYQFLFVEYETESVQQQLAKGPVNKRFRNKANNLGLGIAYNF